MSFLEKYKFYSGILLIILVVIGFRIVPKMAKKPKWLARFFLLPNEEETIIDRIYDMRSDGEINATIGDLQVAVNDYPDNSKLKMELLYSLFLANKKSEFETKMIEYKEQLHGDPEQWARVNKLLSNFDQFSS